MMDVHPRRLLFIGEQTRADVPRLFEEATHFILSRLKF